MHAVATVLRPGISSRTPLLLRGKELADALKITFGEQIKKYVSDGKRPPGLGVILVGENPASQTYVAAKERYAEACGIKTFNQRLKADSTTDEICAAIDAFNNNVAVDGILLQLPLPNGQDAQLCLSHINPAKDVDGLHPVNQGLLLSGSPGPRPCTPLAVLYLMEKAQQEGRLDDSGLQVVVIGRSNLVGKPVALMLLEKNATVSICHSKTKDIKNITKNADVIVAAVGVAKLVKADWIKQDAVVIDVGINRMPDGKLVGDVDFEDVAPKTQAITPVPGGVGPLTVAMLIRNTIESYGARICQKPQQ